MKQVRSVFIFIFFCIISIPTLFKLCHYDIMFLPVNEMRYLNNAPKFKKLTLEKLPREWDKYFNDRLALRYVYLPAYIILWEQLLKSPVNQCVTGENGELFINHAAPTVNTALGLFPWGQWQEMAYRKPSLCK